MASPRATAAPAPHPAPSGSRRRGAPRRLVVALAAALGVLASALPSQAAPQDPATAAEAGALVAARAHDLEVLTEEFNEAREQLRASQAAAKDAAGELTAATAQLADAQRAVRGIARSAWTGEGMSTFAALLTSDDADGFVDRVALLQTVAGHQSGILERAAAANLVAKQAQATAAGATVDAQQRFDAVARQQTELEAEISAYEQTYEALSAQEQQAALEASAAAHGEGSSAAHGEGSSAAHGESSSEERVTEEEHASRDEREVPAAAAPVVADSGAAQIAVDTAMAQRGKPYVWAAAGPGSYDCSGLVQYAFAAAGLQLPHSSRMQAAIGQSVSRDSLRPGDLVFFYSPISHIGIYIGNDQMVHAPTFGDVVKVSDIDVMGGYAGATRVV